MLPVYLACLLLETLILPGSKGQDTQLLMGSLGFLEIMTHCVAQLDLASFLLQPSLELELYFTTLLCPPQP